MERQGKGGMLALVIILVVVNLLSIGGFFVLGFMYMKNTNNAGQNGNTQAPTTQVGVDIDVTPSKTPDPTGVASQEPLPEPRAAKHVANLKEEITKAKLPEGAFASVSIFDGQEYLKIISGEYTIYYRNDYVEFGDEPYGRVIIERGIEKREFAWDYSLKGENIANLVPVIFDWRENRREQMAFVFKKMADKEEECTGIHFVTCQDLVEYNTLSPEMGFVNCMSISGFVETDKETLVCVTNDSRKYYISAGKKLSESEKSQLSLSVVNDVRYSMLNERIFVYSKVELKNIGWIGEISSRVTYSTFDFFGNHSNIFYCYAEQMIMAHEDMLVITPVKDYEDTKKAKVSLTGDSGEKMIFFAKEGMQNSWQDPKKYVKNEDGYMEYNDPDNPDAYTSWGVDVSKFNTVKDWKKVKEAGFDFALIRMGYRGYGGGTIVEDPYFVSNIEGALKAKMDVGVYFFTQAVTVAEAVEEAKAVIDAIKKYEITYPVVLDTEFYSSVEARANYMSVQLRTDIIKAFCETIKKAGYTPMIYSSTNWSLLNYDRSQLDEYDFWYAYYGLNVDYPYHYEIWQYSDSATVPGISGSVDVNICFKKY